MIFIKCHEVLGSRAAITKETKSLPSRSRCQGKREMETRKISMYLKSNYCCERKIKQVTEKEGNRSRTGMKEWCCFISGVQEGLSEEVAFT